MIKTSETNRYRALLHQAGLKATRDRIAVLNALEKAKAPLSMKDLKEKLNGESVDQATIYRTIEALFNGNIVRPVNFQHDHNHYELVTDKHHHHVICEECGKSVDVSTCDTSEVEKQVKKISGFAAINYHALEFFGICSSCAKK